MLVKSEHAHRPLSANERAPWTPGVGLRTGPATDPGGGSDVNPVIRLQMWLEVFG